jgi:hypothetical protein
MALETIYDIQLDGCRYGFVPVIFASLAVYSGIAWYRRAQWVRADGKTQAAWSPKSGLLFFGILAVIACVTTWGDYFHLLRAMKTDQVGTVEGTVSNFHAAATIRSTESFEVAGHVFSYSKYAVTQGFNTLSLEGSPVVNGKTVRVYYVQGQIVRLDVARQE